MIVFLTTQIRQDALGMGGHAGGVSGFTADITFSINGKEAAGAVVRRIIPLSFAASEIFDAGLDTCSSVHDAYFDPAPSPCEGTLIRLHFQKL